MGCNMLFPGSLLERSYQLQTEHQCKVMMTMRKRSTEEAGEVVTRF
jgi:hypothetical protein